MDNSPKELPRRSLWLILGTVTGYAVFFVGSVFVMVALAPLFFCLTPFPRARSKMLRVAFILFLATFTRRLLPLLGVYRIVELSGFEPNRKPAIYVANHRSRIEGPILLGLIRNPGVIMKSDYAKLPIFSFFVKHLDFISVNQYDLTGLSRALDRCREVIAGGKSLLVFPEGTRSKTSRLMPFKDLAFRMSQSGAIPVVPVVIHTDFPFMARIAGSAIPRQTMRLTIRFLEEMHPVAHERPADFAARAEKVIAEHVKTLDRGTCWER